MKRAVALLLVALTLCLTLPLHGSGAVEPSQIRSSTAVLMDANTGQVLYDKGMHHRVYPASVTKILTALIAIENTQPHEMMTASATALDLPWYGAHIALVEGERLSVEDAIFAMMLPSANDASNVLAEHVGGSLEVFAEMMNRRAYEIGALGSNFTNSHGLHDENHFTTAYDIALITRYAMQNEEFRRYFGAAHHLMPATNMNTERHLHQMQYMLVYGIAGYDPEVTGGKVGFTDASRHTMSTTATRDGRDLVAVVMYTGRGDKFLDTRALLDFGFDEFIPIAVEAEEFMGGVMPIIQSGEEIGTASFEHNQTFTALIHVQANPSELQIQRESPEYYVLGNTAPYTVRFELAQALPFVPALLGEVVLEPYLDVPAIALMLQLEAPASVPLWRQVLYVAGGTLAVMLLALVFIALHRIRMARRRRRRRMSRFEPSYNSVRQPGNMPTRRPPAGGHYVRNDYVQRRAR